jgi:hypothetical protein
MASFVEFSVHYSQIILPVDPVLFEVWLSEPQMNNYVSKPKQGVTS